MKKYRSLRSQRTASADDIEQNWRDQRGLTPGLHHVGNAKAANRRKRVLSPKEPKANLRYRRWKAKLLGRFGAASKVRRINPVTGEVMS
jgi:hypothetical protein